MVELQGKVAVSQSRDKVFSILSNIESWPSWWSAVSRVQAPAGGPEKGGEILITLRPHKMSHSFKLKILEFSPGRLTMAGKKRGMAINIKWLVEKTKQGCQVSEVIAVGGPGMFLFRMLGQVEAMGHMVRRNLNGLKNLSEAEEE